MKGETSMSEFNPSNPAASNRSAAGAAGSQPPDFQQLVGLLGNLMPLLLRFQLQVLEPPFQYGPGNLGVPEPLLDQQAAVSLVEDIIGVPLRALSSYIEANAEQNASLNDCAPIIAQAKQNLATRNYTQAFNLVWMAYRAITTIRAADPRLPPLRAGGQTQSDQVSSIH
jgi:hypothetical protein